MKRSYYANPVTADRINQILKDHKMSDRYARWIFWEDDVLMIAMKLKEATWERKIN